jgi:hypothetical protein
MSLNEPLTDAEIRRRLQWLAGQNHGLTAVLSVIIMMHRSPADLAREIETIEQRALADVESTLVPDDFLDGMRDIFDRLKKSASIAQELQTNRSNDHG